MKITPEVNETPTEDKPDQSVEVYDTLYNSVLPIGFMSRKKRVSAYLKTTRITQEMIDEQTIDEDKALFVLSLLVRKYPRFQKAAMMTALNLATIDRAITTPIGFKFANGLRCNLKLLPIDDTTLSILNRR